MTLTQQTQRLYARERRLSHAGVPNLNRTHRVYGVTVMGVSGISTTTLFPAPARANPVTFRTKIRMTADGTVATEHRGVVFKFGGTSRAVTLFVGDDTIGFLAGGPSGSGDVAIALFDFGSELVAGRTFDLTCSCVPNTGEIRLWGNGEELARAVTANGDFGGDWAGSGTGDFAVEPASYHVDTPAASQSAPDGFEVIEALSVYVNQIPRQFTG